jgi:regulatory protein
LDEATLHKLALGYLNRFDASTNQLHAVLMRKVRGALKAVDAQERSHKVAAAEQHIRTLIARFQGSGLLNDQRFAQHLVSSWRERGLSAKAIRSRLQARGVAVQWIDAALAAHANDPLSGGSELDAAIAFAKRRRLASFAGKGADRDQLRRDLARLARAGFAYDVAVRALNAERAVDEVF